MIRPLAAIFPRETVCDTIKCKITESHTYVSKTTIHPTNFGSHVPHDRLPVRPHHRETNVKCHTF